MAKTAKRHPDLVPGAPQRPSPQDRAARPPTAAVALRLAGAEAGATVLFLAADERRAAEIAHALGVIAPEVETVALPGWDCLPYDRVSPSPACMGRRVAALHRIGAEVAEGRRRIVVTSPEALVQLLGTVEAPFPLTVGDWLDRDALAAFAGRCGYVHDLAGSRVDDPGDIAVHGRTVDVFPADAAGPVRVDLDDDDRVVSLRAFDPATQRSGEALDRLALMPATELALDEGRVPGIEHRLPAFQSGLRPLFALLPGATAIAEDGAVEACRRAAARVEDAYKTRLAFTVRGDAPAVQPSHLYLVGEALDAALEAAAFATLATAGLAPVPDFALQSDPFAAFAAFVSDAARVRRVVVAGLDGEHAAMLRALKRARIEVRAIDRWSAAAGPGAYTLVGDFEDGFVDAEAGLALVAAADVYGARSADGDSHAGIFDGHAAPRPGDVVVHEDHGVAILRGLERVEAEGAAGEVLRLAFHDEATLLVSVEEMDRIWRYGSAPDAVTLDRLHTDGWNRRRVKVNAQVEDAARQLVAQAAERAKAGAKPVEPPAGPFARFVARFPFPETRDQAAAVRAVLRDLASGRPMNRLVCGDVGYGKTEVALRAAAAVALAGRQVAVVAPTTVLARQHARTFERRFAGTGVAVVEISRLVDGDAAAEARARLASGEAGIVIGTTAVAKAAFADLALVVIDEEHRFGAKAKAELQGLAPHVLALTATPIPRTLQGALVGVQEVSVLGLPPARRRPVRTFLAPFDEAAAGTALEREARRGGQSFVVVPRVEEIDGVLAMLKRVAPKLAVAVAHGQLAAEAVDGAMVGFADGEHDVLVATSLIENGLDVPRANTVLVWGADRFGLAQLHQLRGRVGRGRTQGIAYLFTPAEAAKATADRLAALVAADRLGAGFDLAAQDLDLRGGGDLVGEEQAGHIRLIGAGLYQRLLARAVQAGRGAAEDRRPPVLHLAGEAGLPEAYVPDAALRLELYARLARLDDPAALDDLRDEIADRFGPVPAEAARLVARRRVAMLAEAAGIGEVVVGPRGAALSFRPKAAEAARGRMKGRWKDDRLLLDVSSADPDRNLASLAVLLAKLAPGRPARSAGEASGSADAGTAASPARTAEGRKSKGRAAKAPSARQAAPRPKRRKAG